MPHLRRYLPHLLLGCGLLLLAGCSSWNPIDWFRSPPDLGGNAHTAPDETGLIRIFGWWSWFCIAAGVIALLASFVLPIVPTRAAAGSVVLGIGLGLAKGFIAKYVWLLYAGFVVGLIAVAWPAIIAALRYLESRFTGKPIRGHTGIAALKQLIPSFARSIPDVDPDIALRMSSPDRVVHPPAAPGAGNPIDRHWTDGAGGAG